MDLTEVLLALELLAFQAYFPRLAIGRHDKEGIPRLRESVQPGELHRR